MSQNKTVYELVMGHPFHYVTGIEVKDVLSCDIFITLYILVLTNI